MGVEKKIMRVKRREGWDTRVMISVDQVEARGGLSGILLDVAEEEEEEEEECGDSRGWCEGGTWLEVLIVAIVSSSDGASFEDSGIARISR